MSFGMLDPTILAFSPPLPVHSALFLSHTRVTTRRLTGACSRGIVSLIMAAMLLLDLPCTWCAVIGFAKCDPNEIQVQST